MHIRFNSTCCAFKEWVMFKVNQKVWCAIYGAGVVTEILHASEGTYPVERWKRLGWQERFCSTSPSPWKATPPSSRTCSAEVIRTSRTSTQPTCESCGLRKLFTFVNLLNERVTSWRLNCRRWRGFHRPHPLQPNCWSLDCRRLWDWPDERGNWGGARPH